MIDNVREKKRKKMDPDFDNIPVKKSKKDPQHDFALPKEPVSNK